MYLGVMGWIGSLITIRGITIIGKAPEAKTGIAKVPQKPQQELQPKPKKTKTKPKKKAKPKTKPVEPEMIVIPMEEIEQKPQAPRKRKH
jgi:hypothetical protein